MTSTGPTLVRRNSSKRSLSSSGASEEPKGKAMAIDREFHPTNEQENKEGEKKEETEESKKAEEDDDSSSDSDDSSSESDSDSSSSGSSSGEEEEEFIIEATPGTHLTVSSGVEAVQGSRPSMEDAHIAIDRAGNNTCAFYGVYDGHGGQRVAAYAQDHLHAAILENAAFTEGRVEDAIKIGVEKTEQEVLQKAAAETWRDGSTIIIGIVKNTTLYMANLGDSEAVLARRKESGKGYDALILSEKHVPTTESEKARIIKLGGYILRGRVFGSLAVSRALGDAPWKNPNYVSADPYLKTLQLSNDDHFIILACDGLWDKMTYAEAVDFVTQRRRKNQPPDTICKEIVAEALARNSLDNVTVVLVFLTWSS